MELRMKEPHNEDLASHDDPESCAGIRKGAGEALTGAPAGRVLSRENEEIQGADAVVMAGRQHGHGRKGETMAGPARSKTPRMRRNSMRENREIPSPPVEGDEAGRGGKARGHKPPMNGHGKSDRSIVPAKSPNKSCGAARGEAEAAEGRGLAKGNADQQNTPRTQSRTGSVSSALDRVREAALKDKGTKFTALLHHVTPERLRKAFLGIRKDASVGVDGVTWQQYEANLEENIRDLHGRLQRGAYRAKPSRRAYIPKADGRKRPLGIAALEDKVVQRAVTEVLNAIYEVDFLGFSYGFRPGRGQHGALDALAVAIRFKKVSWVLDADVRGFFDTISHEWMLKFLEHRIADRRVLRLIQKWLKAGVLEDGKLKAIDEGTPQGSSISPLLANIYLHYVLDMWVQRWRSKSAQGEVVIVRWADDFVMGFQYQEDARRCLADLQERFRKFSLELHPEKTRLIRFGRFARDDCRRHDGRKKPETFNFLGFTHYCTVNGNGKFMVGRKSIKRRMASKLRDVKAGLRKRMHWPVADQGRWLQSVVRGYSNYHAVPANWEAVDSFRRQVSRLWYRTLLRRSQKARFGWERMAGLVDAWLPKARILHPWPEQRFFAFTRGRSPVR
jgi:RNA-directed DNA polymerase